MALVTTLRARAVLLAVVATLTLAGVASSASASASFSPKQRHALRRAIAHEMMHARPSGLVVGLWLPGKGRFVTARGVADRRTGRPLRTADVFRVGTMTETFTSTLVLQLVQQHRLRLDDPVDRYFRAGPTGERITIRELLNHTSGLPNISPDVASAIFTQPHRRWSARAVIRRALRQPAVCAPGTCWYASNVDYLILGQIVRHVTRRPLARAYARLFARVHLRHTTFAAGSRVLQPRAHGYARPKPSGAMLDTTRWNFSWAGSAGAITSTLADLRRWAPVVATGRGVLAPRIQRQRLQFTSLPGPPGAPPPASPYGLGVMLLGASLAHDGSVAGYESLMVYDPRSRLTLVVLGTTAATPDALTMTASHPLVPLAEELLGIAMPGMDMGGMNMGGGPMNP
jgi:D-alanyl-D-alanine carboxypeptidase